MQDNADLLRRCRSFLDAHRRSFDTGMDEEAATLRLDITDALDEPWVPRRAIGEGFPREGDAKR